MSWLFSRALVEAFSGAGSSGGEPCAPLNVMPTPQPFLLSDKTTAFSSPSQFGLTCAALTASDGAAVLMLFLADFPARTSAPPARAPASKVTSPDFGFKWPGSFAKYDHDSRSWKTRQCSLLGGLESFSETWPRWGSMRDGECLALETPELPTYESVSGSWPTIRSTDGERGGRGDLIQAVRGNPNSHYKTWPTPHGFSKDGRSNGPSGNELGRAVNLSLTKDGLYTTPCADDTGHRKAKYAQGGKALSGQVGGSLNPPWVEWLMGWPIEWTALKPLATDRFRLWPRSHGGY